MLRFVPNVRWPVRVHWPVHICNVLPNSTVQCSHTNVICDDSQAYRHTGSMFVFATLESDQENPLFTVNKKWTRVISNVFGYALEMLIEMAEFSCCHLVRKGIGQHAHGPWGMGTWTSELCSRSAMPNRPYGYCSTAHACPQRSMPLHACSPCLGLLYPPRRCTAV